MVNPTAAEATIRRAEEDAHVAVEMERARTGRGEVEAAPGRAEPVTHKQVEELLKGTGSTLGGLQSTAEFMTVYNRYDGVPSQITTDQASQRLRVRFDPSHPWAGQLVWTTTPPKKGPVVGTLKCPLHLESEERAYLNDLHFGSVTCRKATMKTEMDRQDHFQGKHKKVHKAVEADKAKQLQLQQMELMKEQTAAMQAMASVQGAPAALVSCGSDGCTYEGTASQLRGHKMGAHKEKSEA